MTKPTGRPIGRPRTTSAEDRAQQRRAAQSRYIRKLRAARTGGSITREAIAAWWSQADDADRAWLRDLIEG